VKFSAVAESEMEFAPNICEANISQQSYFTWRSQISQQSYFTWRSQISLAEGEFR